MPRPSTSRQDRVARLTFQDEGHGYDRFGFSPDWVELGLRITDPLYEHWFRVKSTGIEHIPAEGPAVLAANHSGTLPFDALMVWADIVRKSEPPRVPRSVMDHFVSLLPLVSTLFTRAGGVGGSRGNFHNLLEGGELLVVFPEGTPGIGKNFRDRYQLQTWRVGHAELAIRHSAPIIPIAVIGAEEQMPQLGRIEGLNLFGSPYLPIPLTLFPLPVRYHIYYGEPIAVHKAYGPEQSDDPQAVREAAGRVKAAVQGLIARGLRERKGLFI